MRNRISGLIAGLSGVAMASAAHAQFVWLQPIGNWQGNMMFNAQRTAEHFAPTASKEARAEINLQQNSESRPASATNLVFRMSPALRRQNLASFVEKSRRGDPQGAAAMERLFASTDVMALADTEMRKIGLRSNNVADAFALWWGTAWLASKGRDDDLAPAQVQAISRQAARGILGSSDFATASDAQKQEMADALIVQTLLISGSLAKAKDEPSMLPAVKAAVAKGARATGLDLTTMTLTDEGFRPIRGSDASGAPLPVGARPEALADAGSTASAAPNYMLLAAAGGAGFAGIYWLGKRLGRRG